MGQLKREGIRITIPLPPVTKKNSQKIVRAGNRSIIVPSSAYKRYEAAAGLYLRRFSRCGIEEPVNVRCLFYMPTRRIVDLTNLLEAADDLLVLHGVLRDDNSRIVVSHDGSRVRYDKEKPRTEIWIVPVEEVQA